MQEPLSRVPILGRHKYPFGRREFEDRTRKSSESVTDCAYSLKYLFAQAYPLVTTDAQRLPFLKRAFLKGVSSQIRQTLIHFEDTTFEELVAKSVASVKSRSLAVIKVTDLTSPLYECNVEISRTSDLVI